MMTAPTVLLLQARVPEDPMLDQERRCFASTSGLSEEKLKTHDLCQGPPSLAEVRRHDAVMVGGAGDYYVSKGNLPHFEGFLDLLRAIVDTRHPMFASCFGYGCLVQALGGEVIHDPEHTEVGTFELTLTEAGRADELFKALPDRFWAQMGRKDRSARHPHDWPALARSATCPFQGLRVPDAPIWASQFHPELDLDTNLERYRHYLPSYARHMSEAEIQKVIDGFCASPQASSLLRRFIELVFGSD